ncbi:hypothetical protein GM182_06635 [bacterium 3DAC]|nr:hypothetical protein GM182_06635 [bacterium 3DAC]
MLDITLHDGDIVEFRAYSETFRSEIVLFRAYIHGDISPEFLTNKVDIYAKLPLSGEVSPTPHVVGNIKPFKPTLIEVLPNDKHMWQPVSSLKDKVVFVLVHGINPEEILASYPDKYDIWKTAYKYHVWDTAHEYIYKHIENVTILHYIYPSAMERLQTNAKALRDKLLNTDIEKAKGIFFIGHSMGGLIIRQMLDCSEWFRDITTHAFTLNTPHRGSPLASLMFTPPEFWKWIEEGANEEKLKTVRNIRLTVAMTYHRGGGVMAQGYLDLRWDSLDKLEPFPQMLSPEIYKLNTSEQFTRYTFTTSTIPRHNLAYPILKLADRMYHEPRDHIGLIMMQRLMEAMGEIVGTGLWYEGDGLVPISSQIPVKYMEDGFTFDILGPMTADHIDIFTSPKVWSAVIDRVKTYV